MELLTHFSNWNEPSHPHSPPSARNSFPLSVLEYSIGDEVFRVELPKGTRAEFFRDGKVCSVDDIVLPNRVVSLTVTPHDIFPLNGIRKEDRTEPRERVYRYLGLRDRSGRASLISFLYTALEGLLNEVRDDKGRRDRIAAVFKLLRYQPRIDITYSLRMGRSSIVNALENPDFAALLPEFQARRVAAIINTLEGGYDQFRHSLAHMVNILQERRFLTVSANVEFGGANEELAMLQLMRRAGYLSIRAIEIERFDGARVDLKDASSGELSIAASLVALAGVLDDCSLVLIDEPEISLHPEWQSNYLATLLASFAGYHGCHYLVATHSPLIVSDVPETAVVYSLDKRQMIQGELVSADLTDELLARLFKLPIANNLYLKDQLVKALRLAADGQVDGANFADLIIELQSLSFDLEDEEPAKSVIQALILSSPGGELK